MDVKAHTKVLPDQPPDPFGCPQLGSVAQRIGSPRQEFDQRPALASEQLGRTARPGPPLQSARSPLLRPLQPLADRGAAHTEMPGDIGLRNTVAMQGQRREASLFESHGISSFSHTTSILWASPIVK